MDLNGPQWISMVSNDSYSFSFETFVSTKDNQIDPNGSQWIPMDPNGSQWMLMKPNGSQWILMKPNGSQWIPKYPNRPQWFQIDSN